MAKKYFWDKANGLNADIERHRATEARLRAKIVELEQDDQSNPMVKAFLRTYRNFLYDLELSKAEVVNLLGKK